MYSVMIVEDEMLVRVGIAASVPWSDLGLHVVAEENNGLTAYESFLKYRPDIVVADIKIPGMSGLELMRAIREQGSTCALIVITCVEEFSVLKEAMSLGVVSYLVKATMESWDIVEAMKKAKNQLDTTVRERHDVQPTESVEDILRMWIVERKTEDSYLCERVRKQIGREVAGFVHVKMHRNGGVSELLRRSVRNIVTDRFSKYGSAALQWDESGILLLKQAPEVRWLRNTVQNICRYVEQTFAVTVHFDVCTENVDIMELPAAIRTIKECGGFGYLYDEDVLILGADGRILDEDIAHILRTLRENAWLFRDGCSISELSDRIDRLESGIFEGWTALTGATFYLTQYIAGRVPMMSEETIDKFYQRLKIDTGLHELFSHLNEMVIRPALAAKEAYERPEIIQAIRYMAANLCGDVSLKRVSAEVGLHPTYFSYLFKQEMDTGFSSFVNVLRIEQARILLRRRLLSIQDVSEQCGFSDVSYFCRKFKQTVGVSPSTWRSR